MGQDRAIEALVNSLDLAGHRDASDDSPLGVLMFVGSTGVGKTYSAELIGKALLNGGLARFNMNEYKEKHEISRLIGAPPGFVGHDQPGVIFLHIESSPRGTIILDEMEKAHPEVQDYFLQIFDKGEARDTHGRTADFRNQVFVMTCNIDATGEAKREIGFRAGNNKDLEDAELAVRTSLRDIFRDEFIARVDTVVPFATLKLTDFGVLFDRSLEHLRTKLAEQMDTSVKASENTREELARRALALEEGVRGFNRLFKELIEQPLREAVQDTAPDEITIDWSGDTARMLTNQPS